MYDVAVIPAAGASSRFHALGKSYPKCVLPYQGVPMISHIVRKALRHANHVIVVTSPDEAWNDVTRALDDLGVENKRVTVLPMAADRDWLPSIPSSPAKTLSWGLRFARDATPPYFMANRALVLLSDAVPDPDLEIPPPTTNENIVFGNPVEDYHRWCMISQEGSTTLRFYDKPREKPPTNIAANGIYCINSYQYLQAIYNIAGWGGHHAELQFSQVFEEMQAQGARFRARVVSPESLTDLGTLAEYLENRGLSSNKPRSFNTIDIKVGCNRRKTVVKASCDRDTLIKEAAFIKNLPEDMAAFFPTMYGIAHDESGASFEMDYIAAANLRHVALYLDRSKATWLRVFRAAKEFSTVAARYVSSGSFWEQNKQKSFARLRRAVELGFIPKEDWESMIVRMDVLHEELKKEYPNSEMFHGDLHFANMFYDFDKDQLFLVDPRGDYAGHSLYDAAKLCHSVYGRYDFIDAELYRPDESSPNKFYIYDRDYSQIREAYEEVYGKPSRLLLQLTASLFLTMIPLHTHNEHNMKLFLAEYERLWAMSLDIGTDENSKEKA